jgi:hypothetical protein
MNIHEIYAMQGEEASEIASGSPTQARIFLDLGYLIDYIS